MGKNTTNKRGWRHISFQQDDCHIVSIRETTKRISEMINLRASRISQVILILCLCFGSLVILPFMFAAGISTPDFSDPGMDDMIMVSAIEIAAVALLLLKFSQIADLFALPDCIAPDSPPPKNQ